jgi:copper chaperone CopZ
LDLEGAHCASCVYTIEHLGRKVKGVKDIKVNTPNQEIEVEYEGSPGLLKEITEIVRKIGYDARIRHD